MWTDNTTFQPAYQPDVSAELSVIVRAVSHWVVIDYVLLLHICILRNIKRRTEDSVIMFLLSTGVAPQWLLSHVTCVATHGNMISRSNTRTVIPFPISINWNGIAWYSKCMFSSALLRIETVDISSTQPTPRHQWDFLLWIGMRSRSQFSNEAFNIRNIRKHIMSVLWVENIPYNTHLATPGMLKRFHNRNDSKSTQFSFVSKPFATIRKHVSKQEERVANHFC